MIATINATSIPMTARVRIKVPKGSPSRVARHSACRTTEKAHHITVTNMTASSNSDGTIPIVSGFKASPAKVKAAKTANPVRLGNSDLRLVTKKPDKK